MRDTEEHAVIIVGGRVLTPDGLYPGEVAIRGSEIVAAGDLGEGAARIDAGGGLVLPGIVDLHGDAFERQIQPRPKSRFPVDLALMDTDRQLLSNGITTAYHGVTVSWEPGLRSLETAVALVEALARLRPSLGCDTRLHIRWEIFALEAVETVLGWLGQDPRPILAFNDHTTNAMERGHIQAKIPQSAERAGLTVEAYTERLEAVWARRAEAPDAIARLAAAAGTAGATLLAHDERSPEERARFRALGATTSEFPMNRETAAAARAAGEHTILGAPNVLRGGSHIGMLDAAPAIEAGLCTVLASDYYYPAPLHAAFRLVRDGIASLPEAWALVSANPAAAAGLSDRGRLAPGCRADVIVVDDSEPRLPRVAAAIVAGRPVLRTG